MLSELQLGEFIYEQPAFPDIEYTFKHALTQEVAYNSVLSERRPRDGSDERGLTGFEIGYIGVGGSMTMPQGTLQIHHSRV